MQICQFFFFSYNLTLHFILYLITLYAHFYSHHSLPIILPLTFLISQIYTPHFFIFKLLSFFLHVDSLWVFHYSTQPLWYINVTQTSTCFHPSCTTTNFLHKIMKVIIYLAMTSLYWSLQAVTADVVRDTCYQYIYDKCPAVAAVGPCEGLPDYNRIRSSMYWLRV